MRLSSAQRLFISLVLFMPGLAVANSDGSPICHVHELTGACPMGNPMQPEELHFTLRAEPASYLPGETITLHIEQNFVYGSFHGLVLYVEDPDAFDNAPQPQPLKVGQFIAPAPVGFQFKTDCDTSGANLLLTHDGAGAKTLPIGIQWTAPATNLGTLRLRGIVLRIGMPGQWTDHPYQTYDIALPYRDDVFKNDFE